MAFKSTSDAYGALGQATMTTSGAKIGLIKTMGKIDQIKEQMRNRQEESKARMQLLSQVSKSAQLLSETYQKQKLMGDVAGKVGADNSPGFLDVLMGTYKDKDFGGATGQQLEVGANLLKSGNPSLQQLYEVLNIDPPRGFEVDTNITNPYGG